MSDLTLKRMDAAIRRIWAPEGKADTTRDRAIFLAGMREAADVSVNATDLAICDDCEFLYSSGHKAHQDAIRATVKRLKKEMRNA